MRKVALGLLAAVVVGALVLGHGASQVILQIPRLGVPASLVLPIFADATANWTKAGLLSIGGIPTRSTQCGSTVSAVGGIPPFTNDDAQNINAAILACAAGQVVQLAAGTFKIAMGEYILLGRGVTLRGNGNCTNGSTPYCNSVIQVFNGLISWSGALCGVDLAHTVACVSSPGIAVQPEAASNGSDFGWKGQLGSCGTISSAIGCGTQIDADAAQGDTTIQVHDTTGFSVGDWVLIDEASAAKNVNDPVGPNLYGQVWAAPDWLSSSGSPATGRVQWNKYGNNTGDMGVTDYPYNNPHVVQSLWDRATSEIHHITAIGAGGCPGVNCTITFDSPLAVAFRHSGSTTFTGSISGTTLTTTGDDCTTAVAQIVSDAATTAGVLDGTYVTAINSCSGGAGNYTVNRSQTVTSRSMIGAAHQAHIYYPTHQSGFPMSFIEQAGIENVTIENPTNGGVDFTFCAYCWAYKVEVVGWSQGAFNFSYTARDQVEFSFSNHCGASTNNGAEYPIGFQDSATEIYAVNNIIIMCGKGMVGKAAAASVVAYNYQDMTMYDYFSAIGNYWVDMGVNASHFAGTHSFLFEGNWGNNCDNDDTHGNAIYHVYFRNQCAGLRTPFTDPSMVANGQGANASESDVAGTAWQTTAGFPPGSAHSPAELRAAGPMLHMYWMAYVGNVMGSTATTTGNGWVYSGDYSRNKNIWMPGWNSDASNTTVSDPNLTGATGTFLFRNGNYDYVNAGVVDNAAGYSQAFPNSLYLSSTPSFFGAGASCTYTYPWIQPTATPPVKTNSCAGSGLPAKARWDAGTPFVQP